jgi:hypothetical protein
MVLQEIRMNLLKKLLLVAIASAGAMGSAQAQTPINLGTLSPTATTRTDFLASGSFADLFNFTLNATHHMFTGSTVKFAPTGVDINQTNVTGLQFQLKDLTTNTVLFTGASLHTDLTPGDTFSMLVTGKADGPLGGGFLLSVAANPEPAEWMMLLCGFVVAGFIARRKMSLVAG